MRIAATIIICIGIALGVAGCAAAGFHPGAEPYSPGPYTGAGA
ncbi:MAG TPA: hypothetical protein VMA53_01165 [Stellaceae bacterium]|nr:hypothetical protein [Stellaceae bacterium]